MSQEGDAAKFAAFMQMHRSMLDCYASSGMNPAMYKALQPGTQRDFCFSERAQLEDQLFKKKIRPQDFFKAAQSV